MIDNSGNVRKVNGTIEVKDSIGPNYSNLIEITDPIQLGEPAEISIDAFDISGIYQVILEYENSNHSMVQNGSTWSYSNWTPTSRSVHDYTIHIEDNSGNWNKTTGSINVIDGIKPKIFNLIENGDPIELGADFILELDITDEDIVSGVLIEIQGLNHSMVQNTGYTWEFIWSAETIGIYGYTIYAFDPSNNTEIFLDGVEVIDSTRPKIIAYSVSNSNNFISVIVQAWDASEIESIGIEINNDNIPLTSLNDIDWSLTLSEPLESGEYGWIITVTDINGNQNVVSGIINIDPVQGSGVQNNRIITTAIGTVGTLGVIFTIVLVRRRRYLKIKLVKD